MTHAICLFVPMTFLRKSEEKLMFIPLIRSRWAMTDIQKFAHFENVSDPNVSIEDIQNELNERLELACSITEA